jgi:hypothetical protein
MARLRRCKLIAIGLLGVLTIAPATLARAVTPEEINQKLQALEDEIKNLKQQLEAVKAAPAPAPPPVRAAPGTPAAPPAPADSTQATQLTPQSPAPTTTANRDIFGLLPSPLEGLRIGMYGEFKFGKAQNPDANGQWQLAADVTRIVLMPSYQFTDSIFLYSEIEVEHGGIAGDEDDKSNGAVEVEQAWVDFKINPYFNIRSPGIDLIPVGYTNLYHEPTLFYSVNRPTLANGLVPTTWFQPAMSVYGKVVENLNYQVQVSSSLEDFGNGIQETPDNNRVPPFPQGYAPGISGKEALVFAKAPNGDFRQLSNVLATAARLSYTPPFIPGLAGSTSLYYTPNTTPRGAYSDTGLPLHHSSLTMVDTEFRYRVPETGFEFRAEYVGIFFGNNRNLRANNDSDPTNNVGRAMYGMSGEIAYHQPLGRALGTEWELVPFYRYTYQNLQTGGYRGSDLNGPTGSGQQQIQTMGFAVFPGKKLVLKLTYENVIDRQSGGCKCDYVLGGVGFYFN